MGYVNYYLIVWDFIHFAKANGIPVEDAQADPEYLSQIIAEIT